MVQVRFLVLLTDEVLAHDLPSFTFFHFLYIPLLLGINVSYAFSISPDLPIV